MADKPTPEELARIRKQLLVDKGPSSRQQSYQFVYWRQIGDTLGQPFDANKIPMSKLYQMRRDPMLSFALQFIKVPLIRAPWYIKCEDAQVAAFVDYALRRIYARFVLQYMLSLDFGFSAIVKRFEEAPVAGTFIDPNDPEREEKAIWDEGNIDPIIWRPFVPLPPEQVEPRWNSKGEFIGIRYDNKKDVPLAFPTVKGETDDQVDVPLHLSLWVTNEKDNNFGSPWGYPRLGYAFRYWWSYWYRWALADRHFEKDADPPAVVRYPNELDDDVIDDYGNVTDLRDIALGIGEQARSGSTIALPSDTIKGLDDKITTVPKWDISYLEGGGNFDVFDQTFDRLEILKLRSVWVPEQAFLEGKGGTSSRNVAQTLGDAFQESQAVLMAELDAHLNQYVIPQLVQHNFPEFKGEATKVSKGFGSEDMELAKALIQLIGQADPNKLEVDTRPLLENLGIPLKSPDMVEAEAQKALQDAIAQAAAAQPPEVETKPGQAGTTKSSSTGFNTYVQPRERIYLAEDPFAAGLPKSAHYEDEDILRTTRETRFMWKSKFADAYEDFVQYLRQEGFSEKEDDDADKVADDVVKGWSWDWNNLVNTTVDNVKRVIRRAGQVELRKANLTTESWNPNDEAGNWAEKHGAALVTGIDDTVRNELRTFLAQEIREGKTNQEIADDVREHFSTFPDWKADRLARTETMLAYNFATLYAAKSAGITRVQALDAQKGPTDPDCERRNGKIFDVNDAFQENLKEHPNGTLSWRLLRSTALSVQKIPRDEIADSKLAWFDPITDTIYMAEDIAPEQEEKYLDMIGRQLSDFKVI